MTNRFAAVLVFCLSCFVSAAGQDNLQLASLGDFRLESGEVIRDLKIGYRTFGELDATKSNAVLFPTWFTGTTKDLTGLAGPGRLADSSKYFVILVDAIGNGISSSPSNSSAHPRMRFPRFTIRDMVRSQYELLTRVLKLSHLRAVMGISMGGMQTFQWVVSYPDCMDKAIPIVGTPQQTSYDLLLWTAELHAIEADQDWKNGEYVAPPVAAMKAVADIHALASTTPEDRIARTSREDFPRYLETAEEATLKGFDTNNWVRQLQAMISHDVAASFGGSLEKAAAAVRAQLLVVVGVRDHMVNPQPALDFAKLVGARTVELKSDCGHLSFNCEQATVIQAISQFLED